MLVGFQLQAASQAVQIEAALVLVSSAQAVLVRLQQLAAAQAAQIEAEVPALERQSVREFHSLERW